MHLGPAGHDELEVSYVRRCHESPPVTDSAAWTSPRYGLQSLRSTVLISLSMMSKQEVPLSRANAQGVNVEDGRRT